MKNDMINSRVKEIVIMLRKMKNITQEHLAELADVSVRTIQRLEKTGSFSPETLRSVAEAFDMDCQHILALANLPFKESNEELEKKYVRLRLVEVTNGKSLTDKLSNIHLLQPDYPSDLNKDQANVTGELLDLLQDYLDIRSDLSPSENISQESNLTEQLEKLFELGLRVFSGCILRNAKFVGETGEPYPMNTAVVQILSADDKKIADKGNGLGVVHALLERETQVRL
jgi:transcriptional regulator with XRE-family HTH domain